MLGSECLEKRRSYNEILCRKLASASSGLEVSSACVIGNTGPRGKMLVRLTQDHKGKDLTVPNTGDTLFLMKGRIPSEAIRQDSELRALVGRRNMGPFTCSAAFHVYFRVNKYNLERFMRHVHARLVNPQGLLRKKRLICFNLNTYGDFILCRVPGGPYDKVFNARYDLENFSDLDADFIVDKRKPDDSSCCQSCFPKGEKESQGNTDEEQAAKESLVKVLNIDYEMQCAVESQPFLEERRRAQERERSEQRYQLGMEVITELMHLSISSGIELPQQRPYGRSRRCL
ncbi:MULTISPECIES: DUF3023 domain-containing protein [Ehrlichia]|uniref:Uncharacterized protein n=1 Tax=Ehrlichia cf. muris str. EmCRT TaxID=1359167 RepID=A0A0F3NDZ2_9RICK|nr:MULTISPECIES: DUF3023 domain-containing protein [Ehrlichia]KJV65976.1 hypothetical protein EMUCRT_0161 [Ehrlichia cf. muris str. EmCRT]OUC04799.1 hypothetical protein DB91_01220 [Ehrlichia sp. Wisconsin_h]